MPRVSFSYHHLLTVSLGVLAMALIATPVQFDSGDLLPSKAIAFAKGGGNGGGNGGSNGNGGTSSTTSNGGGNGGGHAFGRGGHTSHNDNASGHANAGGHGNSVHTFSAAGTQALVGSNWQSASLVGSDYYNHGHRVSTMVEVAKTLGYGGWVGAMQANFGTYQELGISALETDVAGAEAAVAAAQAAVTAAQAALDAAVAGIATATMADLAAAEADLAAAEQALADAQAAAEADQAAAEADLAAAQAALDQTIADAKPGWGPDDSWATVDLDLNGDGVVNSLDLDDPDPLP